MYTGHGVIVLGAAPRTGSCWPVEFLADPDSGFITGQIYGVNGGQYI